VSFDSFKFKSHYSLQLLPFSLSPSSCSYLLVYMTSQEAKNDQKNASFLRLGNVGPVPSNEPKKINQKTSKLITCVRSDTKTFFYLFFYPANYYPSNLLLEREKKKKQQAYISIPTRWLKFLHVIKFFLKKKINGSVFFK